MAEYRPMAALTICALHLGGTTSFCGQEFEIGKETLEAMADGREAEA